MRILFVTYDYLPAGSAEANLISKLIKPLQRYGCHVDVLTTKFDIFQDNVSIIGQSTIFRFFSSRNISLRDAIGRVGLISLLKIVFEKLIESFYIKNKEHFVSYLLISKFYKGLLKYNLSKYDVIIPVCAYFETYLASKKYINKKNLNTKILMYQLDPLANNSAYDKSSYFLRLKLESELAYSTSSVITTHSIYNQKKALNINTDNVHQLEFPSIIDLTVQKKSSVQERSEIHAVFAGYIHSKIRNPEYTLRLFSSLKNVNLKLYIIGSGSNTMVEQYIKEFPDKIVYLGILPLQEALEHISDADFLVNIGNNDNNFIPSKIFDYINTGKPIINIYKNQNCPTLPYLNKYNNCISIYEYGKLFNEDVSRVEKFIVSNYKKRLSYTEIEENFRSCTVEYVAKKFYEIILKTSD